MSGQRGGGSGSGIRIRNRYADISSLCGGSGAGRGEFGGRNKHGGEHLATEIYFGPVYEPASRQRQHERADTDVAGIDGGQQGRGIDEGYSAGCFFGGIGHADGGDGNDI